MMVVMSSLVGYGERKGAGHIDLAVVVAVAGNFVADDSNRQGHFSILLGRTVYDSLSIYDLKDVLIAAAVSDYVSCIAGGEGEAVQLPYRLSARPRRQSISHCPQPRRPTHRPPARRSRPSGASATRD